MRRKTSLIRAKTSTRIAGEAGALQAYSVDKLRKARHHRAPALGAELCFYLILRFLPDGKGLFELLPAGVGDLHNPRPSVLAAADFNEAAPSHGLEIPGKRRSVGDHFFGELADAYRPESQDKHEQRILSPPQIDRPHRVVEELRYDAHALSEIKTSAVLKTVERGKLD